jgi:integrase
VDAKTAATTRVHIEHLVNAACHGMATPAATAQWLSTIGDRLHDRLARAGLVAPRERMTLGGLLDGFLKAHATAKPGTRVAWSQVMRDLRDFFGGERDLGAITADDAERFRLHLADRSLAEYTIVKRLQKARQFFRYAERRGWLQKNPFVDVKHRGGNPADRQHYVSEADTLRLMEAAPDWVWRTIIALSRFAGLRCPSEVLSLRWQDVDLPAGTMWVRSPKTERYGEGRLVPIFVRLRPYLEGAWEMAREGQTHVIPEERYLPASRGPAGWRNANLRTTFSKIVARAGLGRWNRLFHALRASCETDVAAEFPVGATCRWLGNSRAIAARHYLQPRDADFQKASGVAQKAARRPAELPRNDSQRNTRTPAFAEKCEGVWVCTSVQVETSGLEPPTPGLQSRCSPD